MKTLKTILSAMITAAAAISMSTAVFAMTGSGTESDPYIISDYEELKTVTKAESSGEYIELSNDINADSAVTITKNTVLELAGHNIVKSGYYTSFAERFISIANGAELTINDREGSGKIQVFGNDHAINIANGTLILNSGNIIADGGRAILSESSSGKTIMNGGMLNSSGTAVHASNGADFTLNSGTINAKFYIYENITARIYGGEINGLQLSGQSRPDLKIKKCRIKNYLSISSSMPMYNITDLIADGSVLTVNGEKIDTDKTGLKYDVMIIAPETTTAIAMTVTEPKAGNTPDFSPKVSEGSRLDTSREGYYNGVEWYDVTDNIVLSPSDTFKAEHTYSFVAYCVPEEGTTYVKNMTGTLNGEKTDLTPANNIKFRYILHFYDIPLPGDTDKNHIVEKADAILLLRYISALETNFDKVQLAAANINNDENIDLLDVIAILKE